MNSTDLEVPIEEDAFSKSIRTVELIIQEIKTITPDDDTLLDALQLSLTYLKTHTLNVKGQLLQALYRYREAHSLHILEDIKEELRAELIDSGKDPVRVEEFLEKNSFSTVDFNKAEEYKIEIKNTLKLPKLDKDHLKKLVLLHLEAEAYTNALDVDDLKIQFFAKNAYYLAYASVDLNIVCDMKIKENTLQLEKSDGMIAKLFESEVTFWTNVQAALEQN